MQVSTHTPTMPTQAASWAVETTVAGGLEMRFASRLPALDAARLRGDVVAAFPEYKLSVYFRERPGIFETADYVVAAVESGGGPLAGLLVATWRELDGEPFLHVQMNLITVSHQRSGLLLGLWQVLVRRLLLGALGFPRLLAIKTYNPMVYSSLRVLCRAAGATLYPRLDGAQDPAMAGIAAAVAHELCPELEFDGPVGVVRGAGVPRDFYPSLPFTNKRDVRVYFEQNVRPGDRVLCLVRLASGTVPAVVLRRLHLQS